MLGFRSNRTAPSLPNHFISRRATALLIHAATAVVGVSPSIFCVEAATVTFDASTGTTGAQDGTGVSWLAANQWWNGTVNVTWNNSSSTPDFAVIGAGGTGGSIPSLGADVFATGVTFASLSSGAYTITSGATLRVLNNGVITVNNTAAETQFDTNLASNGDGNAVGFAGAGNIILKRAIGFDTNGFRNVQINMNGTGTLTLAGTVDNFGAKVTVNSGTVVYAKTTNSGAHAVGGLSTVAGGVLQLAGNQGDQIYDGANVTVTSGAFDLNGRTETITQLTAAGTGISSTGALVNSSATAAQLNGSVVSNGFSVGGTGQITLNGTITGTLANKLTKVGDNAVVIQGGGDNVGLAAIASAGTLVLNKSSSGSVHAIGAFDDTALTINNGGTVRLSGTGSEQIYDRSGVVINSGGVLDVRASEQFQTLSLGGTGIGSNGAIAATTATSQSITIDTGGGASSTSFTADTTLSVVSSGSFAINFNSTVNGNNRVLTKTGAGTLVIGGTADNVSLGVRVSEGTLNLGKASSASVHAVGIGLTIDSGATARLTGTGGDQIWDNTSITANGTFNMNNLGEAINDLAGIGTITNNAAAAGVSALTVGQNNGGGTFGGVILDGAADKKVWLNKNGSGSLTLTATSTYNTETDINAGTLIVYGATAAAGAGTLYVGNGGTTGTAAALLAGSSATIANTISINPGNGTNRYLGGTGTGTVTYSGVVKMDGTVGQDRSTTFVTDSAGFAIYSNTISGAGQNAVISGAGTTLFSGSSKTYTGNTTVNSGANLVLSATHSSAGNYNIGGQLSGNGTIDLAGGKTLTLNASSVLEPGAFGTGTLTVNGPITLSSPTATLRFEVGGAPGDLNFDILVVGNGGGVSLGNARLDIVLGTGIQLHQPYQIIKATGYSSAGSNFFGTLNSVAATHNYTNGNGTVQYSVSYTSGQGVAITFSAVPEPSSLGIIAAIGLLGRRRRAIKAK